jgi:two-component sensor histidine kinase
LQIVPVLRSRLTGSVIYSLGVRLDDRNGAFAGVVGVNVRPEGIKPTAERGPDAPLLSVWGQDGRFIAASFVDFDPTGRVVRPPTPPGLGIPGSPPRRDGGIEASALVPGWPLVAVASYDVDGVLAGWRREVLENLALAGLVVLGVGALVWFGVRTADREEVAKRAALSAKATADAALKARDLLLKEVHHRVKNSLMMTSSLIYLQEREFADPEVRAAFEQTRRRLNSIGLVHEALYSGSSLEEVDLAGYLQRLLDEIAEGHGAAERGIRIVTEIEPLSLAPNQVTPVGLIVAEVITNAFKHAFGVNGSGVIKVTARLLNFNDIEIEVRDDGKGYAPPEGEGAKGLGTRLIAALSDQLGGVLSLSNAGGAAFRITFPRMTHGGQARAGDA